MSSPSPSSEPSPEGPDGRGDRAGTRRLAGVTGLLSWAAPRASFVEEEILGLRSVVRPGHVCFDVGAEFGLYTYPLAHLTGSRGAVHSFEPLPGPMRVLSTGVRLAGCKNVQCYPIALGRQAEQGELSLPRRRGLPVHGRAFLTSGAKDQGPNAEFATSEAVHVEVSTIDEMCRRHRIDRVDFIKADVEGAEPAVLDGASTTLAEHRPSLLLEIEERHLAKYGTGAAELTRRLSQQGYRMHTWQSGRWRTADEVSDACRNYLFTTEPVT